MAEKDEDDDMNMIEMKSKNKIDPGF